MDSALDGKAELDFVAFEKSERPELGKFTAADAMHLFSIGFDSMFSHQTLYFDLSRTFVCGNEVQLGKNQTLLPWVGRKLIA